MHHPWKRPAVALVASAGTIALILAFAGSLIVAGIVGAAALVLALFAVRARIADAGVDEGRRRVLAGFAALGLALVGGGSAVGRVIRRLVTPDPRPTLEATARDLGTEALELIVRAYHPERSGDLQLVFTPYSSANYEPESRSLVPNDPRSSHAAVWLYLERVPIVVYGHSGFGRGVTSDERVTLADLAPTTAQLMGFDGFRAPDGHALPGITRVARPPRVIVTFVVDGGGWNVLGKWPDAWPNLRRLMRGGITYRNATVGSFPAVTASSHANIGTGAFPRSHGITGHNVRWRGKPTKAWGTPGEIDPSFLLLPTLADAWTQATDDRAWVGEIGYQVWHVGMLGRGGRPRGNLPVGVFWDENGGGGWKPHNPALYRLPRSVPGLERLAEHEAGFEPRPPSPFDPDPGGKKAVCCFPPVIRYQGDLIEAAFDSESIGDDDVTDLLYTTYKAPDYAGHVYNMDDERTADALAAVDEQMGRLWAMLEERFPGEYVLIATADHGQCPPIDANGGVRIDPIQLDEDLREEFGRGLFSIVESVVPSEIYLSQNALFDAGVTAEDVAAYLAGYRYGDNIGPYVPKAAVMSDRLDRRQYAAVLPKSFIAELGSRDLSSYGEPAWPDTDPLGIPPISW